MLDEATRKRRQERQLNSLEKDNFHDDPHAAFAHLLAKTKLPAFSDGSESTHAHCVIVSMEMRFLADLIALPMWPEGSVHAHA